MKLSLKIILLILLIGGIFMFSRYGGFTNVKYDKYSSKDPELGITMDYISGWIYKEHRGSYGSYAQAIFIEPKGEEGGFKAHIALTAKRSSKVSFKPLTIEAMAEDLLTKSLKFKDAKILSNSKIKVLNTEAIDISLAYKAPDKLYRVDAKLIPVKERIIIFEKGDKFYTLRYMNKEEEFSKFERAFYHCIKTLRIK